MKIEEPEIIFETVNKNHSLIKNKEKMDLKNKESQERSEDKL